MLFTFIKSNKKNHSKIIHFREQLLDDHYVSHLAIVTQNRLQIITLILIISAKGSKSIRKTFQKSESLI